MAKLSELRPITMTAGAGGYVMPAGETFEIYKFVGSGTLSGSYPITATALSSPLNNAPRKCRIWYAGQWVLDGNSISIMGVYTLTAAEALAGNSLYDCFYDGSTWMVIPVIQGSSRSFAGTQTNNVALTSPPTNVTVNPALNPITQIIIGTGTLAGNWSIGASGTIQDGETFVYMWTGGMTPNGNQIEIEGNTLTDEEVTTGGVTIIAVYNLATTSWITQKIINPQDQFVAQTLVIPVQTSFESSEVGAVTFPAPFNCIVDAIDTCVNKTVAGTDNGAIAISVNGSPATPNSISIAASAAVATTSHTAITAGNVAAAGQLITLTSSKTTNGGRTICFVKLVSTP